MLFKRYYDKPDDWQPVYEGLDAFEAMLAQSPFAPEKQAQMLADFQRQARITNLPPVIGLDVVHTGTSAAQFFSRDLVDRGLASGWLSLTKGELTLHTQTQGDFVYAITHMPGTYCCHCDLRLEDDPSGASGRDHVQQAHAGVDSPDPSNPAGFRVTNAYECILAEEQHARWNVQAVREVEPPAMAEAPAIAEETPTE